jgi:hypothetical protein
MLSKPPGVDDGVDVSGPRTFPPVRQLSSSEAQVRQSLLDDGYKMTTSGDGKAEIWTKGDTQYVFRPSDTTGTKIDYIKGGDKLTRFIPKSK